MVQSLRPRLTAAQKTELWRRWRRGESLNAIGGGRWVGSPRSCGMRWRGPAGSPRRCLPESTYGLPDTNIFFVALLIAQ